MKQVRWFLCFFLSALLCFGACVSAFSADAPPYRGLDVSYWQGTVDWAQVKAAGVDFAILRCFAARKDKNFETNYAGAKAQGIPVGAYVYMYATTQAAAAAEAQNALNALGGKALALPLFLDVEDPDVLALSRDTLRKLVLTELQVFGAAGYETGIYTSLSRAGVFTSAPEFAAEHFWIARWTCYTTDNAPQTFTFDDQDPNGSKKPGCAVWQFSNGGAGQLYGMSSAYVDLDYCYADFLHPAQPDPPHTHSFTSQVTEPTCTQPGLLTQTCTDCGETSVTEYAPALGHTAADANGLCTRCGAPLAAAEELPGACPFCGKRHDGFFGPLLQFVHTVLAFFRDFHI